MSVIYKTGQMNFETFLQLRHPNISLKSADAVLKLSGEGATIPFIARYRKELTGNLDEVAIQEVLTFKEKWDEIGKRREFILKEISEQGKLTDDLKKQITATYDLNVLEDLYLPYKKKRQTKAQKAREAGLAPLADWLWGSGQGEEVESVELTELVKRFINAEKGITDSELALQGARDILVEKIAETPILRQRTREQVFKTGSFKTEKGSKAVEASKFQNYFEFQEPIASLNKEQNSHRYLAIRRGWMEEELRVSLFLDENTNSALERSFESFALVKTTSPAAPVLKQVARLAYKAYVLPSVETEAHKTLKDNADVAAIKVFSENVRKLLLAAPFGAKAVIGVDPGFRTGCKIAVVDSGGKYQGSFVFHLHSETEKAQMGVMLGQLVKSASIQAIAVGNGTAGRETESFLREALKSQGVSIPIVMVSESGASVYSASEVAREEFPDIDLTVRGAISIARRLQDPLAELVKVDPKSIGVGQYQHDVSPTNLKKSLEEVVDSCVNSVGVDLNTASSYLLARVSGIGPSLAKGIVDQREKKGLFKSRQELLKVGRFSEKVFELAAGFLRISGGDNALDNTGIHPERYPALESFAKSVGKNIPELLGNGVAEVKKSTALKEALGPFTFQDVIQELEKPGRDPREKFEVFQFREDINEVADLKPEMICPGIVTNVANFGAFVDIGVHQDGLVHISELADHFVKDPREVVSPGDKVTVRVLEVDATRKRIALSRRLQGSSHKSAPAEKKTYSPKVQQTSTPKNNFTNNPFAALSALKGSVKPK